MNDKDQKLLSNKAGIDKNANHYLIPYVDSGLPIVTTQGEGPSKSISPVTRNSGTWYLYRLMRLSERGRSGTLGILPDCVILD